MKFEETDGFRLLTNGSYYKAILWFNEYLEDAIKINLKEQEAVATYGKAVASMKLSETLPDSHRLLVDAIDGFSHIEWLSSDSILKTDAYINRAKCEGNAYKENVNSIECYDYAIRAGHVEALFPFGLAYWTGNILLKNKYIAAEYWTKLNDHSDSDVRLCHVDVDADVQFYLGLAYSQGIVRDKNLEDAVTLWRKAAKKGHDKALFYLGWSLWQLWQYGGRDENRLRAMELWEKAANKGNSYAEFCVNWAQSNQHGTSNNSEKEIESMIKSAEQGDVEAHYNLSELYSYRNRSTDYNTLEGMNNIISGIIWRSMGEAIEKSQIDYDKIREQRREFGDSERIKNVQCDSNQKLIEFGFMRAEGEALLWEFKNITEGYSQATSSTLLCFRHILIGPRLDFIGLESIPIEEVASKGNYYKFHFNSDLLVYKIEYFENGKRAQIPILDVLSIRDKDEIRDIFSIKYVYKDRFILRRSYADSRNVSQPLDKAKLPSEKVLVHELDIRANDRGTLSAHSIMRETIKDLNGVFKTKWGYRRPGSFFNKYVNENDINIEDTRGVATINWIHNKQENTIWKSYLDSDGILRDVERSGIPNGVVSVYHTENWEFDHSGRAISWHIKRHASSADESNEISRVEWTYDNDGRVVKLKCCGFDKKPKNDTDGVSLYEWNYDANHSITGRKMTCMNGEVIEEWKEE